MNELNNTQAKRPAPQNILESIFYGVDIVNQNVVVLSENLEDMQICISKMQEEVNAIKRFFNQPAPTEPNAPGIGSALIE